MRTAESSFDRRQYATMDRCQNMFNRMAKDLAAIKNEVSGVQQRDNPARACADGPCARRG